MGVYPYITASIILQLLGPIIPSIQDKLKNDPKEGRKWMEKWTMYLSIPLAFLSAIGQIGLFNQILPGMTFSKQYGWSGSNLLPTLANVLTMIAGTMIAIWLGQIISEYGIQQQGLSLIIFSGIVSQLPSNLVRILSDRSFPALPLTAATDLIPSVVPAGAFFMRVDAGGESYSRISFGNASCRRIPHILSI